MPMPADTPIVHTITRAAATIRLPGQIEEAHATACRELLALRAIARRIAVTPLAHLL